MKKARTPEVKQLQATEFKKWGFHARHRRGPWILKVDQPIQYQSHVKNHEFDSEWVSLAKDGTVTIHASKSKPYAWDGNTPKWVIGKKQFILGIPDGYRDIRRDFPQNLPITWKASLIHDAFYQYLHVIPINKKEVDKIFRNILREEGFFLWPLYNIAVSLFGGCCVKQKGLKGAYAEKYRPVYLANIGS